MEERLVILQQQNEERFNNIIRTLNKISERIHGMNCQLYIEKLRAMDEEQLFCEFCDKCHNTNSEFRRMMDKYGRDFVQNYLYDKYEVNSFEDLIA